MNLLTARAKFLFLSYPCLA